MPAIVSHYLLADSVLTQIQKEFPSIHLHRDSFIWGASGPDLFFAHRALPWEGESLATMSYIFHQGDADWILRFFVQSALSRGDACALSYAFGFASHLFFDAAAHPYIIQYAEEKAKGETLSSNWINRFSPIGKIRLSSVYHNHIEACLDTLYLLKEKHIPIHAFSLGKTCPKNRETFDAVSVALAEICSAWEDTPEVQPSEIRRAMRDWRRAVLLLRDPLSLRHQLFQQAETALRLPPLVSVFFRTVSFDPSPDYANLQHREWISPTDQSVHRESFFELVEQAREQTIAFMRPVLRELLPKLPEKVSTDLVLTLPRN